MRVDASDFELTEEQRLFGESVARFLEQEYPFEKRARIVAGEPGFLDEHWRQFAELGWLGLAIPERYGGLGGGAGDVAVLMEQIGRGLLASPLLTSNVLAAGALVASGDRALCDEILPSTAAGETRLALAYAEPQARYDPFDVATSARRDGEHWRIDGSKIVVGFANCADQLIVSARTAGDRRDRGGISLFLVDPGSPGIDAHHYHTHDGGRASDLAFEAAEAVALIGREGGGLAPLEHALDFASLAVAAEACGAMWAVYEQTLAYIKTREQFGVPIGSFQAIQHRMVDVFMRCELARSMVHDAVAAWGRGDRAEMARAVSAARVNIGNGARLVGEEGIQLHGAIAMTDEVSIGHYLKRITMINASFGDPAWHLARYAGLMREQSGNSGNGDENASK